MRTPQFTASQLKWLKGYNDSVKSLVHMSDRLFEKNVNQTTRQSFENALHHVKEYLREDE